MTRMSTSDPRQSLGKALGKIASGVFVLTVRHEATTHATLVSWVQQAAFEPPTITLALGKERDLLPSLRAGRRFALSILGAHDHALMRAFARGVQTAGELPVPTRLTASGQPYLADAAAYLECELTRECDFGADHVLLVAAVIDGAILKDNAVFTHVRGNGFHY